MDIFLMSLCIFGFIAIFIGIPLLCISKCCYTCEIKNDCNPV